jgi:diguanylate cyclase (GGDEF)-like protein
MLDTNKLTAEEFYNSLFPTISIPWWYLPVGIWLAVGTLFPLFTMYLYRNSIFQLWNLHPDLMIAGFTAIIVETTVIIATIVMVLKLRITNNKLLASAAQLEHRVAERTHDLSLAVAELEEIASTDHLTKIANRRSLKNHLKEEFRRSLRTNSIFTVISFDIDHFKIINDTYGHPAGDLVLIAIANKVTECIRDIDIFGRYGGEEFLIILPDTTLEGACEITSRIKSCIEELTVDGIKCTISAGIVSNESTETCTAMIESVDEALYAAKDSGRNTIRVFKPGGWSRCAKCLNIKNCKFVVNNIVPYNCNITG